MGQSHGDLLLHDHLLCNACGHRANCPAGSVTDRFATTSSSDIRALQPCSLKTKCDCEEALASACYLLYVLRYLRGAKNGLCGVWELAEPLRSGVANPPLPLSSLLLCIARALYRGRLPSRTTKRTRMASRANRHTRMQGSVAERNNGSKKPTLAIRELALSLHARPYKSSLRIREVA